MSELSGDEERELSALVDELSLSDCDRRFRRYQAASARLKAVAQKEAERTGQDLAYWIAPLLQKARMGEPLTDDEVIVVTLGFTREGWQNGEPAKELERRGLTPRGEPLTPKEG